MTVYKNSSAGVQRKIDRRLWVMLTLALIWAVVFVYFVLRPFAGFSLRTIIVTTVIFFGGIEFFGRRIQERELEKWTGFELIYAPDHMTQIEQGAFKAEINRSEVTKITRTRKGLIARSEAAKIFVPRTMDNFVILESKLDQWRPIRNRRDIITDAIGGLGVAFTAVALGLLLLRVSWQVVVPVGGFASLLNLSFLVAHFMGMGEQRLIDQPRNLRLVSLLLILISASATLVPYIWQF